MIFNRRLDCGKNEELKMIKTIPVCAGFLQAYRHDNLG
jgi:hypothetical protein